MSPKDSPLLLQQWWIFRRHEVVDNRKLPMRVGAQWGGPEEEEAAERAEVGCLCELLEFFDFTKLKLSLSAEFQHCHNLWKDMAECVEERGRYVLHNIQALVAMWTVRWHIQVHSNKGTALSCLIWNSYYVKSIK